jgi:peptidoglycan/xylan/chitin deacetylase (PgdA/CDA1 family)
MNGSHTFNRTIPILLYHSVDTEATPRFRKFTISPERFDRHMAFLDKEGYQTWTVSDWVENYKKNGKPWPEKTVILTFDDGFADFYTNAMPILSAYNLAATIYITTGYIGGTSQWMAREGEADRPMLSWDQVVEINAMGIECGAHTCYHPSLDALPTEEKARQEIEMSKTTLEDRLGQEVKSFAYPYGHYDSYIRDLVRETGFSSACAVKHALSSKEDDRLALARVLVAGNVSVERLRDLLSKPGLRVAPFSDRFYVRAWRFVRRIKTRMSAS